MRASRALRQRAVAYSTEHVLANLIYDSMPRLIDSMRRMHDIQRMQNERLWKNLEAATAKREESEA